MRLPTTHELPARKRPARSPLIGWQTPPPIVTPPLRAAAAYKSIGTLATGGLGAGASPGWGTHASGDYGVLVVVQGRTDNNIDPGAATLSVANGFTAITGGHKGSTYTDGFITKYAVHITTFECLASSGSMSAPTVNAVGSNYIAAFIVVFDGTATSAVDVVSSAANNANDASVIVTGATTTVASSVVLVAVGSAGGAASIASWTNSDLSSITERVDATSTAILAACATGDKAAAGAYGNTTATLSSTGAWAGVTIALKPPTAATSTGGLLLLGVG